MGKSSRSKYDLLPFETQLVLIDRQDFGTRTDGQPIMIAFAHPGSAEGDLAWTIKRLYYDNSSPKNLYVGSDIVADFNQSWTLRSTVVFVAPSAATTTATT